LEHPLIQKDQLDLRKRVVQLLKESYSSLNTGNIVFVCGGNDPSHMRILFREYCRNHKPSYQIFLPEYAIKNYFSEVANEQFDIADFEMLIGELSHAIVVFPEAPGSFAETGYFSAVEKLVNKIVLSLDAQYQGGDSFISLGPAKKIGAKSKFHPIIQTNYAAPDFEAITRRIERFPFSKKENNWL
jgi:predicted Rossmann-fold nucleotide-binding protein